MSLDHKTFVPLGISWQVHRLVFAFGMLIIDLSCEDPLVTSSHLADKHIYLLVGVIEIMFHYNFLLSLCSSIYCI